MVEYVEKLISKQPPERFAGLKLIVTDVDGVLTDGSISYTNSGEEIKTFDVKDGAGIKYWQRGGGMIAFLTGRASSVVMRRAEELAVDFRIMNSKDKLPDFYRTLEILNVKPEQTVYVGDDWPDIPCIREAGLGVAVSDATVEAIKVADVVTSRKGGHGAMREVIDTILYAQGKVDALMARYQ